MNPPVLFQTLDTASSMKIGIATLNSPQTLNGLSLEMCKLLAERLHEWENDESIAFVVLNGAGERAFCAGGDLHGLYRAMQNNATADAWNNPYAREFFELLIDVNP